MAQVHPLRLPDLCFMIRTKHIPNQRQLPAIAVTVTAGNTSFGFYISWRQFAFYITLISLAALFLWKGIHSWVNYADTEMSFRRQHIFGNWSPHLAKANISAQLLAGLLLLAGLFHRKTRIYGLGLTTAILAGYTSYTQLALLEAFGFDICTCIGWFEGMSWMGIFIMNSLLLVVVIVMLFITLKERRPP